MDCFEQTSFYRKCVSPQGYLAYLCLKNLVINVLARVVKNAIIQCRLATVTVDFFFLFTIGIFDVCVFLFSLFHFIFFKKRLSLKLYFVSLFFIKERHYGLSPVYLHL